MSDGRINQLVLAMCQKGLATYDREDVDAVLTHTHLDQCEYATLALVAYQYRTAFGALHCPTQQFIETRAAQSPAYQQYTGRRGKRRNGRPTPPPPGDPLLVLREPAAGREAQDGATCQTETETQPDAKEEPETTTQKEI